MFQSVFFTHFEEKCTQFFFYLHMSEKSCIFAADLFWLIVERYTMYKRFVVILLMALWGVCAHVCAEHPNVPVPAPMEKIGIPYMVATTTQSDYVVTTYTQPMEVFDSTRFADLAHYASKRKFHVSKWYGTLNGTVYANRGSMYSMMAADRNIEIIDAYERYTYTRDKSFFCEVVFAGGELRYTMYADQRSYPNRKLSALKNWVQTSFLRRLFN